MGERFTNEIPNPDKRMNRKNGFRGPVKRLEALWI